MVEQPAVLQLHSSPAPASQRVGTVVAPSGSRRDRQGRIPKEAQFLQVVSGGAVRR
jgi:hypothetical protein